MEPKLAVNVNSYNYANFVQLLVLRCEHLPLKAHFWYKKKTQISITGMAFLLFYNELNQTM